MRIAYTDQCNMFNDTSFLVWKSFDSLTGVEKYFAMNPRHAVIFRNDLNEKEAVVFKDESTDEFLIYVRPADDPEATEGSGETWGLCEACEAAYAAVMLHIAKRCAIYLANIWHTSVLQI